MIDPLLNPQIWRYWLARWPIEVREKFGAFANFYESQGMAWQEAEHKAYLRVEAILAAHAQTKPKGWKLPVIVPAERPAAVFEPEPGTIVQVSDGRGGWRGVRPDDRIAVAYVPDADDAAFLREWNAGAAAKWDREQEAAKAKAQQEEAKQQARLNKKTTGPYAGEVVPTRKKPRARKRKPDPKNAVFIGSGESES